MLIIAGFFAPYLVALAAFPYLAKRGPVPWSIPLGSCLLIVSSPWLVPADLLLLRLLASISAAIVAIKVIDVALDVRQRSTPTWREYFDFLINPFIYPRLFIRSFQAVLRITVSPALAHKPSNQCRRWRATAKRSVGILGFTLGFSQNAPTASTL